MSYLDPSRFHFAGGFRADVSTVNNNPAHYDDAAFKPDWQLPLSGAERDFSNWQPAGTGAWRLLDCLVTSACRPDVPPALTAAEDAAVGLFVRPSRNRSSAKIVDLDPQQQGVSMLFGLSVELVDAAGRMFLKGNYDPAAFFDLRSKRSVPGGGGDAGRSAYFQSTLGQVEWGDVSSSPCLTLLRRLSAPGLLSIRMITDKYQMSPPLRGYGRVVGTIGPYLEGEPRSFVFGRRLAVSTDPANNEVAQVDVRIDETRGKILLDVGNALAVGPNDEFDDIGELSLEAGPAAAPALLGAIDYAGADRYKVTAGVFELPPDRRLTAAELAAGAQSPLRLMARKAGAAASEFATERDDGVYVRAEPFVARIEDGETVAIELFATQFGRPFAGATPAVSAIPFTGPDNQPLPHLDAAPKTDALGRARLTLTGVNPGNPRGVLDGQIYGVFCTLAEAPRTPDELFAEGNLISVMNYDPLSDLAAPDWDDVKALFKSYGDLYPRPHGPDNYAPFAGLPPSCPVVNLADRAAVTDFARRILWALRLPVDHPSHMPVTRDLSAGKRRRLIAWLSGVTAISVPPPAAIVAAADAARPVNRSGAHRPLIERRHPRHS